MSASSASAGWAGCTPAGTGVIKERASRAGRRRPAGQRRHPVEATHEAAVKELGFRRAVVDYRDVINDPEVDVVSICSPNFRTARRSAAAAAGKPFWIEKPMGVSAGQSRDIAQAAAAAGVVTSVGFNYRHTPALEKAREIIREGQGSAGSTTCAAG